MLSISPPSEKNKNTTKQEKQNPTKAKTGAQEDKQFLVL